MEPREDVRSGVIVMSARVLDNRVTRHTTSSPDGADLAAEAARHLAFFEDNQPCPDNLDALDLRPGSGLPRRGTRP